MGSKWRDRLYEDPALDFPIFARLRLIRYTWGDRTHKELAELCGAKTGEQTWKNILNGMVADNPVAPGGTVIRPEYLKNLQKSMADLRTPLPPNVFSDRMTEAQFQALIAQWRPRTPRPERQHMHIAASVDGDIPEFDIQPAWSRSGERELDRLTAWWEERTLADQKTLGFHGPAMTGKTVLVASWVKTRPDIKVCWFDCRSFQSYEFTIDAILRRLMALHQDTPERQGYDRANIEARVARIQHYLKRLGDVLFVFDSLEALVENGGDVDERPKDLFIIEFLREFVFDGGATCLFCSHYPLQLFPEIYWVDLASPTWIPLGQGSDIEDIGKVDAFGRLVRKRTSVSGRETFSALEIVQSLLNAFTLQETKIFAFMVLLGEEVRASTLTWFCTTCLNIPPDEVEAALQAYWATCRAQGAVPFKLHYDVEHDHIEEADRAAAALHFKFHDAIAAQAAEQLEREGEPALVYEIHRRIAQRARGTMDDRSEYKSRNVVGRFTRPAQVVKHILASISPDELREEWRSTQAVDHLIARRSPPSEDEIARWESSGYIFRAEASAADRFYYAYEVIYRGIIDHRREHSLSRVNGADRAKFDLLMRFFDRPGLASTIRNEDSLAMPLLPVDLLVELLAAIAVSGLNAGALSDAMWAADKVVDVLARWEQQPKLVGNRDVMVAFIARVRVDILTRAGRLSQAMDACVAALDERSEFRRLASKRDLQKMQLRYANIIFCLRGITSAISYLRTIGLEVQTDEDEVLHDVDLTGLSGRIWVMLLLRTLRGGPLTRDTWVLNQVKAVQNQNWANASGKPNEGVALTVLDAIIGRIDTDALAMRNTPIVAPGANLEASQRLLRTAHKMAWNRGVNTPTRLDLELETARLEMLLGNHVEARRSAEQLARTARACGYKLYEYDALMLAAEIIWEQGLNLEAQGSPHFDELLDQADALLERVADIEMETGYHAHHHRQMFIRGGVSPTRRFGL